MLLGNLRPQGLPPSRKGEEKEAEPGTEKDGINIPVKLGDQPAQPLDIPQLGTHILTNDIKNHMANVFPL